MQTCPLCNSQNRDNAAFCSNCGTGLKQAAPIFCTRCGSQNVAGSRFCPTCGNALTASPAGAGSLTGLLPANALLQARYLILRKLGQGGMGAVYQANDTRLTGKLWAIKEMSDAQIADPVERANAVAAFRREAQLLATLDHTNLPNVSDYFQETDKQYLVMDFVQGQTLEAALEATTGFLSEATVMEWMMQLCDVLHYLHTRQPPIVFRDLKPANIMLTPDNKIKLIDFGIARFFRAGKTRDTAAYGTMGYASPEQFGTGQTDARSDIYSLGVTLHHLLTRYDPSLSPFNLPPAQNINPNISTPLAEVITRATKAGVAERFQTMREMRQEMHHPSKFFPSTRTQTPITPIAKKIIPSITQTVGPSQPNFTLSTRHLAFSPDSGVGTFRIESEKRINIEGNISSDRPWLVIKPEFFIGYDVTVYVRVEKNLRFDPLERDATIMIHTQQGMGKVFVTLTE